MGSPATIEVPVTSVPVVPIDGSTKADPINGSIADVDEHHSILDEVERLVLATGHEVGAEVQLLLAKAKSLFA